MVSQRTEAGSQIVDQASRTPKLRRPGAVERLSRYAHASQHLVWFDSGIAGGFCVTAKQEPGYRAAVPVDLHDAMILAIAVCVDAMSND